MTCLIRNRRLIGAPTGKPEERLLLSRLLLGCRHEQNTHYDVVDGFNTNSKWRMLRCLKCLRDEFLHSCCCSFPKMVCYNASLKPKARGSGCRSGCWLLQSDFWRLWTICNTNLKFLVPKLFLAEAEPKDQDMEIMNLFPEQHHWFPPQLWD